MNPARGRQVNQMMHLMYIAADVLSEAFVQTPNGAAMPTQAAREPNVTGYIIRDND